MRRRPRAFLPALLLIISALAAGSLLRGAPAAAAHDPALDLPGAPPERGAAATWLRLLRLGTTASVLHTTAHPDDEQGGLLAWLAYGRGVRTALLTLNRGEAGDNALGPALFDALGLLRTEELRAAGRFYGLDGQYYTTAADYGFSKRLDEALEQWDREQVLRDMVRAIRTARPLVVVSRWQGNPRDGHGQHQAAGALTPEAIRAAADPARFPELAREGLRPWIVRRLYVAGVRADEPWTVRVDTGEYNPVLGDTYQNIGRLGLSFQRSQNAGRFVRGVGPAFLYYRLREIAPGADSRPGGPRAEMRQRSFFDGIDTTLPGIYDALGRPAPPDVVTRLQAVGAAIAEAGAAFTWHDPAAVAPALARALTLARRLRAERIDEDVRFVLAVKEREIAEALNAALGVELQAIALPPGTGARPDADASFAPAATLDPLTPGQACDVRVTISAASDDALDVRSIELEGPHLNDLTIVPASPEQSEQRRDSPITHAGDTSRGSVPSSSIWRVTVHNDAESARPYFERTSIAESHYTVRNHPLVGRPSAPPLLTAVARYEIGGAEVSIETPVVRRESHLPYGYRMRELEVLPPVTLAVVPRVLIVHAGPESEPREVFVDVTSQGDAVAAAVSLEGPEGWTATPASVAVALAARDQRRIAFRLERKDVGQAAPANESEAIFTARARIGARTYDSGYEVVAARDLPVRYLTRDARLLVRVVDVSIAPGLRVGYVMGVGDEVPAAIRQLGAAVDLLTADDLASGDLSRFDSIVTGTRAYAVRADLRAHNQRLLDYVKAGGNLIVLYNTPELAPGDYAPYPAELPANAEEICEERAPVELLQPDHPLLSSPNRITSADFDGWIEQRGSKFFSRWDARYTPLLSSHDRDQPPQRGGMLHARYGRGHYTYMAYALHRQLPAGVPGAYRLLANLLSLGRSQ